MKKLTIYQVLLLLTAVLISCSQPQVLTPGSAKAEKMSESVLAAIDSIITQAVDSHWIAGATALVARNSSIVYNKAFGVSNIETGAQLKTDDIFRIASQTKALTSIALMKLYEQGKFQLIDPVSKYIPEFAGATVLEKFNPDDTTYTTVPASREITILDLFTHTSGIDYAGIGSPDMNKIYAKAGIPVGFESDKILLADKMKALGRLPLVHQPGAKWTYGLNIDVLGYLVEVISGENLSDFMKKNLFEPLGMKDTYFYLPDDKKPRLVDVNTIGPDGKLMPLRIPMTQYPLSDGTYFSGGAGLSSTTADYAAFLQMILNKGTYNGNKILLPETVDLILSNHIGELSLGKDKFGLGFQLTTKEGAQDSGMSEGSYSWGGYFSTTYWGDPQEKLVCLLYVQQSPMQHGEIHTIFKKLVYKSLEK